MSAAAVRCGVYVPNFGAFGSARAVAAVARAAEDAGWDGVFVWDHVVRREGDVDLVDPWIALAAAAAATDRVTLGPLVVPLARRRPWNVAKAAVSLDHLSAGRAVLGVGLGTTRGPEFSAFGEETDPRRRGDLVDEGLEIIRAAWSGEPVHHRGHWTLDGPRFLPRPLGPLPIWGACESLRGRPVRRAARLDGVFPIGIIPEEVPELLAAVAEAAGGEIPAGYQVVTSVGAGSPHRLDGLDRPEAWEGSGLTWWLHVIDWDRPLDAALATLAAGPPGR